jgi:3-phenylpropionate/trans-cinnamate dioxygenase ferredoxin component
VSDWRDVCAADAVVDGGFQLLETDELVVAVFNLGGNFHAIEDVCTHDGEELAGGPIDGDQIICPRHGARFCIRTGAALTPPAYESVRCFAVRIEDGTVQVDLNSARLT